MTITEQRIPQTLGQLLGFSGLDQPPEDVIRSCVHCGFCLPACPTYRETMQEQSSPRGRIWLIRAVSEGKLDIRDEVFQSEMSLCLNCRACEAVCPSGVEYGELIENARAQIARLEPKTSTERLARRSAMVGLFGSPQRFRTASSALRFYQRSGLQKQIQSLGILSKIGLESQEAMMPELSDTFFVPGTEYWPAQGERRGTVALLSGCVMSTAYADIHRATARVLARNGYDVVAPPEQVCCGALAIHGGELDIGRDLARRNIDAFDSPEFDAVLMNAAGCGAAMKEYAFLLRDDPAYAERAERFSHRVKDATEFLASNGLVSTPGELPITVTYQEPCHLAHAQKITAEPRAILNQIPGLQLQEMPESSLCCGSAGVYNLLQPDMSSRLLARKLKHIKSTGVETVVSANPGCILQLEAGIKAEGLPISVIHIMSLMDLAYRGREAD